MYIAMNRFRVALGQEDAFETLWRTRERRLPEVPGYVEFHLLKGPVADDHRLYATHTLWRDYDSFLAWTKSEQFRSVHARAGQTPSGMFLGGPHFEGFEVIMSEDGEGKQSGVAA